MTTTPDLHIWRVASATQTPDHESGHRPNEVAAELVADCHRRRRGPYSGGGALLRHVVPELLDRRPELAATRCTEIDAMAPELAPLLPRPPVTLTNTASSEERTRFYAVGRTQRLAHGIAELLSDWARACRPAGAVLELRELEDADETDLELVTTLLRRCDPAVLTLIVATTGPVTDDRLADALATYARRVRIGPLPRPEAPEGTDPARWYVERDGLRCGPAAELAYIALPEAERARLHSERAVALASLDDAAVNRGALCHHRERGLERSTTGARTLHDAVDACFELGYYHAAMDLAERGRALVPQEVDATLWSAFTHKIGACLSYLGRGEEAVPYLSALRQATTNPIVHMSCAYMTAMLFTRLLPRELHDENLALGSVNTAIAFADSMPEGKERVFFGAFMRNARALVDLHRGDIPGALDQVETAIRITDEALGPDQHQLHRSVLRYNRAQVLAASGRFADSLADYDEAIRRDPDYGDYYFDRAAVHRSAGEYEQALADYEEAMRLTPPFYEAHYNRADLLLEMGAWADALTDLDYALELEPTHVDSLLARADLRLELGEVDAAAADIRAGLAVDPDNAHLHAAHALVLTEQGSTEAALGAYAAALAADPRLAAAWANRAVLRYTEGQVADAVADLGHALALGDDAALRVNRAVALRDLGRDGAAREDLVAALDLPDADVDRIEDLLAELEGRTPVPAGSGGR